MNKKILIGMPLSAEKLNSLNDNFDVACIEDPIHRYEAVMEKIEGYEGLLAVAHPVDQQMMEKAPGLKIIATRSVGYDHIDIEFAKSRGIAVSNTPHSTTVPTANHAIGLLLSVLRKIAENDKLLRKPGGIAVWEDERGFGTHVEGQVLGIIGMGRIGKAVAKRAQALGMECRYFNRTPLPESEEDSLQLSYRPLEELLAEVDVLSLHLPLTDSTHHLLDASAFAKMKPGSFIINTARGGVIDQNALIEALLSGHLAGAGLDVFEEEPHIPQTLLDMPQVVLAPHHGTATRAARNAMLDEAFGNIVAYLTGGKMTSRVV